MKHYMRFFKPEAIRKNVFIQEKAYEGNKNLLKFVEDHYKCPQTELLSAPKVKRKIFPGRYDKKQPQYQKRLEIDDVPPGFFLTIIFSIQGSLFDISKYLTLYTNFGAWMVLVQFGFIYIFIAMPLYMVFFFLSNYTRNAYMKIWMAVPILKGVSFSVAMLNFVTCIFNMSLVTLHLLFIIAAGTDWLDCGFPYYADGIECSSSLNQDQFCSGPNMTMPKVGTYVFLKHAVQSKFGDMVNYYWILIVFFIYTLIILGEMYCNIVLTPICRLTTFMWGVILVLIMTYEVTYGASYTINSRTTANFENYLRPAFWVACAKVSLRRVMPGDLVTYGSLTMPGMSPITIAVLMSLMRILFTTTVANFFVISLNHFIDYHKVKYEDCLELNGLTVLYCFIPDQLLQHDPSRFTLVIYFFVTAYLGSMSTFLSINGFLTAITEDYPECGEYKLTVVVIMCFIMCIANVMVIGFGFEFLIFEESKIIIAPLLIYCCIAFFMTSYSPLRIANDFYFAFGHRLSLFWSSLMKLYVMFVWTIATFYLMFEMHNMKKNGSTIANIVALGLTIAPIVLFATIRIYRAKNRHVNVIQPIKGWGSPNPAVREARAAFDAKRECRIMMELKCYHECLVETKYNEVFLKQTVENYQDKLKQLQDKMLKLDNVTK